MRSLATALLAAASYAATSEPLNVVVIMTDDQGWADVGCYGAEKIRTPNLDRMAKSGMRFTDWHSPSPVCTPSRAGLLTGCLPARVGLANGVLKENDKAGLDPDEVTIADMLKKKGYATACFGKWHLGDRAKFLPMKQGFDTWLGIPYSNDMTPCLLMENGATIEQSADMTTITRRYTDAAISFIESRRDGPFFIYLPHTMPHLPLAASRDFAGKSGAGPYGDAIEELDHETGRLLGAIDRLKLAERTLVVYTSDNGPWKIKEGKEGKQGKNPSFLGSAGPFRGSKGDAWEGGHRVPCIWSLPGTIPAGSTSDVPAMHIDMMPTIASMCDAELPAGRGIDGADLTSALRGEPVAALRTRTLYHYSSKGVLAAVRSERWKFFHDSGELFDLKADPGESRNVASANPAVVKQLKSIGDTHTEVMKREARPAGR